MASEIVNYAARSRPVDAETENLPLSPEQIECLRAAARNAVEREVAATRRAEARRNLLAGLALGATLLCVVLWALGFGNPR